MLEPRIETKPAMRVVGLETTFISGLAEDTNAGDVIGPLWGAFHERVHEIQAAVPGVFYGWCFMLPPERRTLDEAMGQSRPDVLGYVAGIEVASGAPVPEGMVAIETEGGLYAVFEHRGHITRFGDTLRTIYRDWLPNAPYRGNGIGDIERYDERWAHDSEDSVFEYWVGIAEPASS